MVRTSTYLDLIRKRALILYIQSEYEEIRCRKDFVFAHFLRRRYYEQLLNKVSIEITNNNLYEKIIENFCLIFFCSSSKIS